MSSQVKRQYVAAHNDQQFMSGRCKPDARQHCQTYLLYPLSINPITAPPFTHMMYCLRTCTC